MGEGEAFRFLRRVKPARARATASPAAAHAIHHRPLGFPVTLSPWNGRVGMVPAENVTVGIVSPDGSVDGTTTTTSVALTTTSAAAKPPMDTRTGCARTDKESDNRNAT